MQSLVLTVTVLAVASYVLVLGAVFFWQERILFPGARLDPAHQFIKHPGLQEKSIAVDGSTLNALHYQQENARGLIFFLHGNAGNLSTWVPDVDFYKRERYDLFMLDYRGYGKSAGRIQSQQQIEADVLAAWESIAPQYQARGLPVVIYGRSIGTYFATWLAQRVEAQLLVLVSPYTSMLDMLRQKMPFIPRWLLRYPLAINAIIDQVKMPVLLLHGELDQLIPVKHSHTLAESLPGAEFLVIDDAAHSDIHSFKMYNDVIAKALP